MDGEHFDALVRQAVARAGSRRGLLGGAMLGAIALLRGPLPAGATPRRVRDHRAARVPLCHHGTPLTVASAAVAAHLRHGDQLGDCGPAPVVTPEPSCAGSNGCGTERCGPNDACFCRIAAQTGTAFCGGTAYDVLNCSQCGGGTVCVNLTACGAVGCAPVCSSAE